MQHNYVDKGLIYIYNIYLKGRQASLHSGVGKQAFIREWASKPSFGSGQAGLHSGEGKQALIREWADEVFIQRCAGKTFIHGWIDEAFTR